MIKITTKSCEFKTLSENSIRSNIRDVWNPLQIFEIQIVWIIFIEEVGIGQIFKSSFIVY